MPTENERKYVLNAKCERAVADMAIQKYEISQGYLIATRGITVRVRKSVPVYANGNNKGGYFFTMKVNTGGRCVEVENKLDKRDFDDLWAISLNKLEKIRYDVRAGKYLWECDFFKDYKAQTYIAIAEIELPEGQMEPDSLPPFIKDNLLYRVALTDTRFSNKLLGDARYAADLLTEITKK
jgi:CYTH domain-containing protein